MDSPVEAVCDAMQSARKHGKEKCLTAHFTFDWESLIRAK
jgi:hypothetical protein